MIRFACPGCGATFSVPDEKAGTTGTCPTCSTAFVIPAADPAAPPPLPGEAEPPPLPDPRPSRAVDAAVEIKPCPSCGGRLSVAPADLGTDVECPYCKATFRAARAKGTAPAPPPAPPKVSAFESTDNAGRPLQYRDDADDDRPSRRRRRDDLDDDADDDRPRIRTRRRDGQRTKPEKVNAIGGMMLAGGIIAVLVSASSVLFSAFMCCLWPGNWYGFIVGIMLIVRGAALLGRDPGPAPHGLAIAQIILIINFDVINLVLGILAKVFLADPDVTDYFGEGER
jgi:hypothetical protein